ncbi:hybrid sensor histidine kinase/response regulator [Vibrio panuliri]|uniref:histidine kinase n=1 Tax=Vibrio panuliri TaxID=1381081 RepID=A0ABX3FQI8_9VIBR|nr:hybrid sensor histidine kinase/response regulator [Vibrio panuliri]KAB1454704.1 hybrid sensor histidine kinase/response regulator [Vibrio panuliri]OLQ96015.1 hybrid sensor histidine kinase/response regulator [Vibrio panuliri]
MFDHILHPVFILLIGVALIVASWAVYFIRSLRLSYSGFDRRIGTPYLLYSSSILMWVIANAFFYSPLLTRVDEALVVSMALFTNLAAFAAFVFACLITQVLVVDLEKKWMKRLQNILIAGLSIFAIYLNYLPGHTVLDVSVAEVGQFEIIFGPQTKWFISSVVVLIGLSLHNVVLYSHQARPLQQVKSLYMLTGIFIFMISSVVINGVVPYLWQDFSLTWLPPTFAISEMLLIGYALITSRFYSNRHVLYSGLSLIITSAVIVIPLCLFINALSSSDFSLIITISCLVTGFTWAKLQRMISRYVSEIVFGQAHSPERRIRSLGDEFQKSTANAFAEIAKTLDIAPNELQLVSNLQDEKLYTSQLYNQDSVLIFEEIEELVLSKAAVGKQLKKIYFKMKAEQVSLVLPIFDYNNRMSHLLLAKNKRSGEIYYFEEVKALQHVLARAQGYINADRKVHQAQALANSIAHEMRNPLAQVQLQFEKLDEKLNQNACQETLKVELDKGQAAIERGRQLIDIILREVNNASLEQEPTSDVSMRSAVNQAIERYAYDSDAVRERIHVDISGDFSAKVNETLFNFVIFNLLRNGIYYFDSHPDAQIEIKTLSGKYENFLIIRDTGPGIPSPLLNRIFDDFFSYNKPGGSGLGLGYCRRVMKSFGGSIQCYSKIGCYTEFHLSFPTGALSSSPLTLPESEPDHSQLEPQTATAELTTVMVVDDKDIQRQLVKLLLTQLGYNVILANNGQVAVDMLEQNHIDFIFMDVQMPVMDGFQAASIIKQRRPNIPIYALSGESGQAELEKIRQIMDGRLTKPTTKKALQQALESVLV